MYVWFDFTNHFLPPCTTIHTLIILIYTGITLNKFYNNSTKSVLQRLTLSTNYYITVNAFAKAAAP